MYGCWCRRMKSGYNCFQNVVIHRITPLPNLMSTIPGFISKSTIFDLRPSASQVQNYMLCNCVIRFCVLLWEKMNSTTVAAGAFFIIAAIEPEKKKKRSKRMWLQNLFTQCTRGNIFGILDNKYFQNFTRMSSADFEFLINLIGPKIEPRDIRCRQRTIPVKIR